MRVQVAANILQADQIGQFVRLGPVEFAASLAQLRRNQRQIERRINIRLLSPRQVSLPIVFDAKDTIFIDLQAALFCQAA